MFQASGASLFLGTYELTIILSIYYFEIIVKYVGLRAVQRFRRKFSKKICRQMRQMKQEQTKDSSELLEANGRLMGPRGPRAGSELSRE